MKSFHSSKILFNSIYTKWFYTTIHTNKNLCFILSFSLSPVSVALLLNARFDFGRLTSGWIRSRERFFKLRLLAQSPDFFIWERNVYV